LLADVAVKEVLIKPYPSGRVLGKGFINQPSALWQFVNTLPRFRQIF